MQLGCIDFETFYDPADYSLSKMSMVDYIRDPRFRCLGFSIKLLNGKPAVYVSEHNVAAALKMMRPKIEEAGMIAQNTMFDAAILNWKYGIKPKMWFDTMLMARGRGLHHPDKAGGVSLAKLSKYFGLGEKAYLSPDMTQDELKLRATVDTDLTIEVFKRLLPYPKEELEHIDWTIRTFSEPMIYADVDLLQDLIDDREARMGELLQRVGYTLTDLRSPALFASALERFGVDAPLKWSDKLKRNTWAFAKTDEGMAALVDSDDDDVALLAQARLESKASGDTDRALRLIRAAAHGPVPMPLGYCKTHTTRWAGEDGLNPQNFKRGGVVRESLQAPSHHQFVVGDSGQVECRMTAFVSGQQDLVDTFAQGIDVYSLFGTRAFGRPVSKATEYERFSSKTTVLGAGFGAGGKTLTAQAQAEIRKRKLKLQAPTQETFDSLVDSFRGMYRNIPMAWNELGQLIGRIGSFGPIECKGAEWVLPNGLSLYFPNLTWEVYEDGDGERRRGWRYDTRKGRTSTWGGKLMENVASSLSRAILAEQMRRIRHRLQPLGGRVVLMVHDEIVSIVPDRHVDEGVQIYNEEMIWVPEWAKGLPLSCEIGVGERYGSAKR